MRLDLICSNDDLRPTMNHVKVDAKECIATNAHILGVIPTSNIFEAEFIEALGDRTILIHSTDWKHIKPNHYFYWESEHMIGIKDSNGKKRPIFIKVETEDNVGKYPNWQAVVPALQDNYKPNAIREVGINAELLVKVQKALNFIACKLEFTASNRAIMIHNGNTGEGMLKDIVNIGNYGLIMPTMIK